MNSRDRRNVAVLVYKHITVPFVNKIMRWNFN